MADAAPKTQIRPPYDHHHHHESPSKFFLYKAALVTVCLVLVPLFPSLAPDFFSQTLHARSWELLQLIFVGIAVSYGLFSKKNEAESQKESSKIDHNAHSYVSKLLQVSSVFDDESEPHTVIEETSKFEALSSQYYRGEPVVVVAKEDPDAGERNGVVSKISQKPKPLLLPVRSLRQRVPSPGSRDLGLAVGEPEQKEEAEEEEEEEQEKTVLRSPIPWRSRSGRMDMKEISGDETIPSPSKEEGEVNRSLFRAPKIFAPPPPAPPPPPSPAFLRRSVLMKSSSALAAASETKKALARSARSVPGEFGGGGDGLVKSIRKFRSDDEETSKFFDRRSTTTQKENVLMQNAADEGEGEEDGDEGEEEEEESDEFDEERFAGSSSSSMKNVDVDKKADEFIAKFREQIRLQRIESIRRSTAQRAAGKSFR